MNAPADSFVAALSEAGTARAPALRRASLMLHTLAPEDRAWLLERVPPARRTELAALVDELRQLGIPPAPELIADLAPRGAAPARAPAASLPAGLASADPGVVASVLAAEPADLVARIVSLGAWPWTGAMLARLGANQRRAVMELLADGAARPARVANRLDDALVALLESHVATASALQPPVLHEALDARRQRGGWGARARSLAQGLLR